jgi:hypothetical protein
LLAGLLLATVGCAHESRQPFVYDADGVPQMYKRRERHIELDLVHHIRTRAYLPPHSRFLKKLSDDQKPIVEEFGRPDWVRRPYRSFEGEAVNEWVYMDWGQVFQFVDDKLVYQGPLTDYEQILLKNGYPSRALSGRNDAKRRTDLLVYSGVFESKLQQYFMVDGKLTQMQEGD